MDSQVIEIIGRNRLVDELLVAGLEVALPLRDRGIDLLVYADTGERADRFQARPIQMKAASRRSFSIHRKYAKFPDLLFAFVWGLDGTVEAVTYALSHKEAVGVATKMGYTETKSWKSGAYSTTRPSKKLQELLEPYRMTPETWRNRITGKG